MNLHLSQISRRISRSKRWARSTLHNAISVNVASLVALSWALVAMLFAWRDADLGGGGLV